MLLLAALAALIQAPLPADTVRAEGGPTVVWSRAEGLLLAVRLSVPLPADLPPGTAELLQELARPAALETARRFGAAIRFGVADDEATLSLTGPAAAFDALAGILRSATGEPDLSVATLRAARARAEDRLLGRLERPEPRLRAILHARLHGRSPRGPALEGLAAEQIRALARRLHRADRLRVQLVGDLPAEIVRSAFSGWADPATAPATHPGASEATGGDLPSGELPPPQAHHAWAALAYDVDAGAAAVLVAAELVARRLSAAGVRGGAAEAWLHDGAALLVVLGGAAPNDPAVAGAARITAFPGSDRDASGLARFLRRMVAEAASLAGPDAVADAAGTIRRRMLLDARTVSGRARMLGDGVTGPGGQAVLDGLVAVDLGQVRAVLDAALAAVPLLVEVRP